jgi:hypothetical protein
MGCGDGVDGWHGPGTRPSDRENRTHRVLPAPAAPDLRWRKWTARTRMDALALEVIRKTA